MLQPNQSKPVLAFDATSILNRKPEYEKDYSSAYHSGFSGAHAHTASAGDCEWATVVNTLTSVAATSIMADVIGYQPGYYPTPHYAGSASGILTATGLHPTRIGRFVQLR